MRTKILIDNGHGANTPGKCSPDLRLKEYAWTREIARRLVPLLRSCGYDAELLVPEEHDVTIKTRAARANRWYVERGGDVLLLSVHINAADSDWCWHSADYWSAWTWRKEIKDANGIVYQVREASKESKALCKSLYDAAIFEGFKISGYPGKTADFGILRETLCPAVLVENFFQDNKANVEWLLSEEGKQAVIRVLFMGMENYINPI